MSKICMTFDLLENCFILKIMALLYFRIIQRGYLLIDMLKVAHGIYIAIRVKSCVLRKIKSSHLCRTFDLLTECNPDVKTHAA